MKNVRHFLVASLRKLPFGETYIQARRKKRLTLRYGVLKSELAKVPIIHSGIETIDGNEFPYVVLDDKTTLFGRWPNEAERGMYTFWKDELASSITPETIRVAMDVVLRYLYPHAMPHLTMPYSREKRSCCHPQHIETIEDLPEISTEQKNVLKETFIPNPGDTFLDIGAYMGYGAIRMSKALGLPGKVIAVEADPDSRQLLEYNVRHNHLTNVIIIPKAIWDRDAVTIHLNRSGRQSNSLVDNIISTSDNTVPIQTMTIDTLLQENTSGCVDIVSITINGAEVEAIRGMRKTLRECKHIHVTMAGWYERNGVRICDIVSPILRQAGLRVYIGQKGGLLAWK